MDHSKLWASCLEMIKARCPVERMYDVWFGDVAFESYDADGRRLLLQVPHMYVYEFLELPSTAKLLSWAITSVFGEGVTLQYRIVGREPSFAEVAEYLRHNGYDSSRDPYHIAVADARKRMEDGLHYFLKGDEQWLPGYDRIAEWLTDNKGRGLLVVGTPGLGKSLICQKILPVILGNGGRRIPSVAATDIKARFDELMKAHIAIIDDLGKEPRKHFGNTDNSFFELCNNAERTGKLLVITTNLSTTPVSDPRYPDSIEQRYGADVLDRLKAITKMVRLEGDSLRR